MDMTTLAKIKSWYFKVLYTRYLFQYLVSHFTNECFDFPSIVLTEILLDLEAAIDSFDVPSERGLTKPGVYV